MNRIQKFGAQTLITAAKAMGIDELFRAGGEHPAFVGSDGKNISGGISGAYSNSWIAYACIVKQAKDISGVPLHVVRDPDDIESVLPDNDRLVKLLKNPHPTLTHNQLLQFMVTMLRLRGAFFLDFDNPDQPTRIVPWRDPQHWRAIPSVDGENIAYWTYRYRGKQLERMPSDVVVCRQIDPTDPFGWQSPLAAAKDPLTIDREGDHLNASTIGQGGQAGPTFRTNADLGPEKYQQLIARLQQRIPGKGEPPRPLILTGGLEVVDPKFTTTDLNILAQQEKSAEKICAIYGMSPSLLYRDDVPNRATYQEVRRRYWSETLIPIIRSIESAMDEWTYRRFGVYCRFDLSAVQALRDDLLDLVKVAKVLHSMNIPVTAINERLDLGLNIDMIPGADQNLVASSLIPVSAVVEADYSGPAADSGTTDEAPQKSQKMTAPGHRWKLTNEIIQRRHRDAVAVIARGKARTALEVRAEKSYRSAILKFKSKAVKAASEAGTDRVLLRSLLGKIAADAGESMAEAVAPYQRDAAVEGALSILDLVSEERMYGTENADVFRKSPELPHEAVEAIRERQAYLRTYKSGKIIEDIFDKIERAATDDYELTAEEISGIVKGQFNVEINAAKLIGRQEVGTAFNASRFGTMKSQDIRKHEWETAGDELVRGSDPKDAFSHIECNGEVRDVGSPFPTGLAYPQENGGEPGNTINCRCLTLPVVEV